MRKAKRKTYFRLLSFLIIALTMLLGYAFLTTNLNITGTTILKDNRWDIHLENVQVLSGSVQSSTPTIDTSKTSLTYSITLNKPGDYFDFTVDVKNSGTIDGMIEKISNKLNGSEISTLPPSLDYNISYLDGTEIENNQILESGEKETIHITVIYKTNISSTDLPSAEENLNFMFSLTYIQKDNTAITGFHPNNVYTAKVSTTGPEDINENQAIQNTITQYQTATEVMNILTQTEGRNIPFCLKHQIKNNLVVGNFIEFTITDAMHQTHNEVTPGTYTIKGGGATIDNENSNQDETIYLDNSIYYDRNVITIERAFGKENCFNKLTLLGNNRTCRIDNLEITVYLNGEISMSSYEYDYTDQYYLACSVYNNLEFNTRATCYNSSR